MTLNEIFTILENRLMTLKNAKINAVNGGDLENVIKIDNDIITTQITIDEIKEILNAEVNQ